MLHDFVFFFLLRCFAVTSLKKMYCMLPFIVHVIEMFKVTLLVLTPSVLANVRELCSFI